MASKREKKSWSSRKKKLWLVICLIIITSGLYAIFVYLNTRNTGTKFEYTLSDKSLVIRSWVMSLQLKKNSF
ncbi:MAG: hypothetical protein ACLRWM_08745 [Streptococcus sp.]